MRDSVAAQERGGGPAQHQAGEKWVSVRTERSSASLDEALGEPPSEEKGGAGRAEKYSLDCAAEQV